MDSRLIELDGQTTERCVMFANALVRRYANGETPQSLAFSSHGMEKDELGQARAKMAECILAVWLSRRRCVQAACRGKPVRFIGVNRPDLTVGISSGR